MKRNPSQKAIRECAFAMKHLLDVGWQKSDLDALEALWWEVHDDNGNILTKCQK